MNHRSRKQPDHDKHEASQTIEGSSDEVDGAPEFVVQKITDKRIKSNANAEWRVNWLGYDSAEDTWEPIQNLSNSIGALLDFEGSQVSAQKKSKKSASKKTNKMLSEFIVEENISKLFKTEEIVKVVSLDEGVFFVKWSNDMLTHCKPKDIPANKQLMFVEYISKMSSKERVSPTVCDQEDQEATGRKKKKITKKK